jgi:hypothetical protein
MLLLSVVLFHQNSLDTYELAETATQSVGLSPENELASQLIALALINPRTRQRLAGWICVLTHALSLAAPAYLSCPAPWVGRSW